jgi:dihydroneopterin aldolase
VRTTRLFLTWIRCEGRHGANPEEKDRPQPFVVDLDLDVDVGGDAIGDTADYRAIAQRVRNVVAEGSFDLLETIAAEVAAAVRELPKVLRATAVVHKPNAARSVGIDGIAAAVTSGDEPAG